MRRFIDAGRSGDTETARSCLVRAEQRRAHPLDYRDLGPYRLAAARPLGDGRAVVTLHCGEVQTPMVAVLEAGAWKVSLRQSLQQMQNPGHPPLASAPR